MRCECSRDLSHINENIPNTTELRTEQVVKMIHWDGATGVEFVTDTRVELDLKGEKDSIRGEKAEGLFRKREQVRKVGGKNKKDALGKAVLTTACIRYGTASC